MDNLKETQAFTRIVQRYPKKALVNPIEGFRFNGYASRSKRKKIQLPIASESYDLIYKANNFS